MKKENQINNNTATNIVLELNSLSTGYIENRDANIVSSKLNEKIKKGDFVALIGTNGCGKSTLMRTICGLQAPIDGKISIEGINIDSINQSELTSKIALVLTEKIEVANMTVYELISMGRYPYTGMFGKLKTKDKKIIEEAIEKCNCTKILYREINQLSDGQRQRVMIAKALAQDTPIILLDEPTSHLDIPNRVEVMRLMHNLAKVHRKTIIMATHELDLALQWASKIWLMNTDGEIQSGLPEDIVLSKKLSKVFDNEYLHFDLKSGTFKTNMQNSKEIYVDAIEPYHFWVSRALERNGFNITIDRKNNLKLKLDSDEKWILTQQGGDDKTAKNIEELLSLLDLAV